MNTTTVIEILLFCLTLGLLFIFQLNKKLLCLILKPNKIYLPFIPQDLDLLQNIKKEKKQQTQAIVRSCEIDEYIHGTNEELYHEFDMLLFFIVTCLLSALFSFIKTFSLSAILTEPEVEDLMNIPNSFLLIIIGYICLVLIKRIFINGYWTSPTKQFVFFFLVSFIVFNMIELLLPDVFNIKYAHITNQIVSAINKRLTLNPLNAEMSGIEDNSSRNILVIKGSYSIAFAMIMTIGTVISLRIYQFDLFLLNTVNREEISKNNKLNSLSSLDLKIKLKIVLNLLLFLILIDSLVNISTVNQKYIYAVCLFGVSLVEMILNLQTICYISLMYHNQNYVEAINFCSNPSMEGLTGLKARMDRHNSNFWNISYMLFVLCFIPFLLVVYYLYNSELAHSIIGNKSQWDFKNGFIEGIVYVMLIAIAFVKGVIFNGIMMYHMSSVSKWDILKYHQN